jgi:hypothetical protein
MALREAERTVSGALFLLLSPSDAAAKTELRSRFSAGVCATLIRAKQLTSKQAQAQLSETQLAYLNSLSLDEPDFMKPVWGEWLFAGDSIREFTLFAWLEAGSVYVAGRVRGEPEPPRVDWAQREQEFRQNLSGFSGKATIDLKSGVMQVAEQQGVVAQARIRVLGSFQEQTKQYLAGWADPSLSDEVRPFPVFGCASQLFRLDLTGARSEARRAAWLGEFPYLWEYSHGDSLLFLGVGRMESVVTSAKFQLRDVLPEMVARFEALEKDLSRREPERLRDTFRAQGEEVRRLAGLFEPETPHLSLISDTSEVLLEIAREIKTETLFGRNRSSLSSGETRDIRGRLSELGRRWDEFSE